MPPQDGIVRLPRELKPEASSADDLSVTAAFLPRRVLAIAVALLALAAFGASDARARACGSATAGTAYFNKITAGGVSCATAKRLLDRTTLVRNRGGAAFWRYAGWRWSITGLDEFRNRITGKRGTAVIRAIWSQS
jgi:hypothetical protein